MRHEPLCPQRIPNVPLPSNTPLMRRTQCSRRSATTLGYFVVSGLLNIRGKHKRIVFQNLYKIKTDGSL